MPARGSGWGLFNRIQQLERELAIERRRLFFVRRGYEHRPVDVEQVKREAIQARELMKGMV